MLSRCPKLLIEQVIGTVHVKLIVMHHCVPDNKHTIAHGRHVYMSITTQPSQLLVVSVIMIFIAMTLLIYNNIHIKCKNNMSL